MSSPEQYYFEQQNGQAGQEQPDLLPAEFQWQPINTGTQVAVGVDGSPGTDGGFGSENVYVQQDPSIAVDGTTFNTTDGSGTGGAVLDGTGGMIVDGAQGQTGMLPGMNDAYLLPGATDQTAADGTIPNGTSFPYGMDQYVLPQSGTDQFQVIPPDHQTLPADGTGNQLPPIDQTQSQVIPPGGDQQFIPIAPAGQIDQTQVQPFTDQTATATDQPVASTSEKSGGGVDAMWWLDRGLTLGSTAMTAQKLIPNLSTFMAEGQAIPSLSSLRAVPKNEWMTAAGTDLGRKLGGGFLATTLADATLLKDYDTSLATVAVDIATPFLLNKFRPGMGVLKTIGATLGVHAAEKILFEGKKEE